MNKILASLLLLVSSVAFADDERKLDISILSDWESVQYLGSPDAVRQEIQHTIDEAAKIYKSNFNIILTASYIEIPDSPEKDMLSNDTNPNTLLVAVENYRVNSKHNDYALTLLVTTRNLTQNKAGIATINTACSSIAAGIVKITYGLDVNRTTMAHEIGHILAADHDGDPKGLCPVNDGKIYVMSDIPFANNTTEFSACSIETIKNYYPAHSCVAPIVSTPVKPPVVTPTAPTSNGGGGSMDWVVIVLLIAFVISMVKNKNKPK